MKMINSNLKIDNHIYLLKITYHQSQQQHLNKFIFINLIKLKKKSDKKVYKINLL